MSAVPRNRLTKMSWRIRNLAMTQLISLP
jgi:hypothetical protein